MQIPTYSRKIGCKKIVSKKNKKETEISLQVTNVLAGNLELLSTDTGLLENKRLKLFGQTITKRFGTPKDSISRAALKIEPETHFNQK